MWINPNKHQKKVMGRVYMQLYATFASCFMIVAFFIFALQIVSAQSALFSLSANNTPQVGKVLGVAYEISATPYPSPTASPTPPPTPSPTPTPIPSSSGSPSPTPTPTPTPISRPTPTPTPVSSPGPSPSPAPEVSPSPKPSPTPSPTALPSSQVSPTPSPTPTVSPSKIDLEVLHTLPKFLRGDTNGDGSVDISDIVFLTSHINRTGSILTCLDAGDVNDNGKIDMSDVASLQGFLFLGTHAPLAPYPTLGSDPTNDALGCTLYAGAVKIEKESPSPSPSASPSVAPSISPRVSASPFPSSTPAPSPSPTFVETSPLPQESVFAEKNFRRGDTDGDASITPNDITTLILYLSQSRPLLCADAADTNDDGEIDYSDVVLLANYYSLNSKEPPAPGPKTAGKDKTKDTLGCATYPRENAPSQPQAKPAGVKHDVLSFIDTDRDGISDRLEVSSYKSNPLVSDSDGDGYLDGAEAKNGFSPVSSSLNAKTPNAYAYGAPKRSDHNACASQARVLTMAIKKNVNKNTLKTLQDAYCYGGYEKSDIEKILKRTDAAAIHPTIAKNTWQKRSGIAPESQAQGGGGGAVQGEKSGAFIPQFRRGDANTDGTVDISDVTRITELYLKEKPLDCKDAGDANDDGTVDVSDASYIANWLFLGGTIPPLPGPKDPGMDPTNDSLDCASYDAEPIRVSLNIRPEAVFAREVQENTNDVLLGKFTFIVRGAELQISQLPIHFRPTTQHIQAKDLLSKIYVKDIKGKILTDSLGVTIDSKTNPENPYLRVARFTNLLQFPIGEHVIEVYGSVGGGWDEGDTIESWIFSEQVKTFIFGLGTPVVATPEGLNVPGVVISSIITIHEPLKPKLQVSLSEYPVSQNVVTGTNDFEFAQIRLNAADSASDISITEVRVKVVGAGLAPNIVSNIQLFDGATKIPANPISLACGGVTCSEPNTFAITAFKISAGGLKVAKETSKVIRVLGDIGTAEISGSFFMALVEGTISAVDDAGRQVVPTYTVGNSSPITIVGGGNLGVAISSDPRSSLSLAGTRSDIGKFSIGASFEDIRLNAFGFTVLPPDGGIMGDDDEIDSFELWELGGASPLGRVVVNSERATITPAAPIIVARNSQRTFILRAKFENLSSPGSGSPAESGAGFKTALSYIDATGTSAASTNIILQGFGQPFNSFHIFKSLPAVALGTVSNRITGTGLIVDLMKFNVKADSAGPVALAKFTFGVSTTTVSLLPSGFYLYESSNPQNLGDVISNTNDFRILNTSFDGNVILESRFDVNNDDDSPRNRLDLTEHLIVSAGASRYFSLRGTIDRGHDGVANNESIASYLAGDDGFASTRQVSVGEIDGSANDDFIWSDLNFDQYSSSTATNSQGWFNGFRVPGLESTTSTPQVIVD